jgi:glucosamine 6-phosphate synthetase-like amidotransferase/phosphosugar isomerase protein
MCGIFGSIGANEYQNRTLAILNEERGNQSAGFYADNMTYHITGSVRDALIEGNIPERILDSMVYLGHTRQATTGEITVKNCHPFRYGNIIGAHNGIVSNFDELKKKYENEFPEVKEMECDSQIIIWMIANKGVRGLREIECYAGVWWVDLKKPNRLYLWNFKSDLAYAFYRGAFVFSSDRDHLKLIGCERIKTVKESGQMVTIKISERSVIDKKKCRATEMKHYVSWKTQSNFIYGGDDDLYWGKEKNKKDADGNKLVTGVIDDSEAFDEVFCPGCDEAIRMHETRINAFNEIICADCGTETQEFEYEDDSTAEPKGETK